MQSFKQKLQAGIKELQEKDESEPLKVLLTGLQGTQALAAYSPTLLKPLLEAYRDRKGDVMFGIRIVRILGKAVAAVPALSGEVCQLLLDLHSNYIDDDSSIINIISRALGKVLAVAPVLGEVEQAALRYLLENCLNINSNLKPLKILVQGNNPVLVKQVMEHLLHTYLPNNASTHIDYSACDLLAQVIQASPEPDKQAVLEHLSHTYQSGNSMVRIAVLEVLGKIGQANPELAVPTVLKALEEIDSRIFCVAFATLGSSSRPSLS